MYLSKSLPSVLVPKYYKSVDNLIEDAFRALLNLKPGLKVEIAIELYLREEISLSRAVEMAGMDIESFKDILKVRGLKVSSYIGSKDDIESGLRLI
jgi:predicted HTH domain antitoxin